MHSERRIESEFRWQLELRHNRLEVVPIGTEPVQPKDRTLNGAGGEDFDAVEEGHGLAWSETRQTRGASLTANACGFSSNGHRTLAHGFEGDFERVAEVDQGSARTPGLTSRKTVWKYRV